MITQKAEQINKLIKHLNSIRNSIIDIQDELQDEMETAVSEHEESNDDADQWEDDYASEFEMSHDWLGDAEEETDTCINYPE